MKVNGQHYRTIWLEDEATVRIIDQKILPYAFRLLDLHTVDEIALAIKTMLVRGAGLIGAAAGYGMYLASLYAPTTSLEAQMNALRAAGDKLIRTRPTAVNLAWAVQTQLRALSHALTPADAIRIARETAQAIADEDADACRRIGEHGLRLIADIAQRKGGAPVNILTHCNAGWLAFVDYGSATAPIYRAHDSGLPVHVWVDETRPRNQGARLTAWELGEHGVPHTVIVDNVGGHLMQKGKVDMVIVGSDRTTVTGDVANKIGTYLKALAAKDNDVPFYVALPSSTFDWQTRDGVRDIPIEERDAQEVTHIEGIHDDSIFTVRLTPEASPAVNYGFDVTPARLVTALITERGICPATEAGIRALFPSS